MMNKLTQSLEQRQKFSPKQILETVLLQMNSIDLEQKILEELEKNPALELQEIQESDSEQDLEEPLEEIDWEEILNFDYDEGIKGPSDRSRKKLGAPIQHVHTAVERLLDQITHLELSEKNRKIAEVIIWNIDEQGYLLTDLELLSDRLEVGIKDIEKMLQIVQRLDPPGIGARDLQECLLIQLELLGGNNLSINIIKNFFDDFANRRFERLENKLNCSKEELNESLKFISHLNPKPGEGSPTTPADYILPDLIVEEVDGELIVSVNDGDIPEIGISKKYKNLIGNVPSENDEVKKFLHNKIESAKWFVQAVQQRQINIVKVMKAIIFRQDLFFSGEITQVKPMILKDIAEMTELDISTISRVTRGKYVQTPWGVFELKHFFSDGIMNQSGEEVSTNLIKSRLKSIIENEDKKDPISDDGMVEILQNEGFSLARRTIAKYRNQMKIPVARLRRIF
tara:strand:+ start:1152 stop:2516 length:1365 start_codon:yes stop_codon:yes gene_type:complete